MKDLKTYISNIEPQLLRQVTGKMGELIHVVQENNFLSERALMQHFIGTERNPNYYYTLKSKTLKILQALAIVSSFKEASEVKKKLDLCRKKFLLGQKFIEKGTREEGISLIRQAQKIAVEYNFTLMASELSSLLYNHHVYYKPNQKKAVNYALQVQKYSTHYKEEKKAEDYFYQAVGCINRGSKLEEFKSLIRQIKLIKVKNLKCKTYQSMLEVLYGLKVGDYHLMIKSSKLALDFFKDKKGVYISHYHFFFTNLALAQIAIKHYLKAAMNLDKAKEYTYRKSRNDYGIKLYQAIFYCTLIFFKL